MSEQNPPIDVREIRKILPHRYPFLLVDRVVEWDMEEKRITCLKNLTINEGFFQGHFPHLPVMPGVLQLEALAQSAGILLNKYGGYEGRIAFFTSVDKARFRRPCVPGDQLIMKAELVRLKSFICKVKGEIFVEGELACEAELMFAFGREDDL